MSKRNKIITNNSSNKKVPNEAMEDGIYRNARTAHVAASLIGCPVQVRVKNGTMYDGILATISPEVTIVLEIAHKSNENGSNVCLPLTKDTVIIDTIVINWPDVVTMTALNVDLSYASKESFATDTAISGRSNGQAPKTRDLQPFECDGPAVGGLEDGENGWSPDDMFQTNESKFTIQSSFNQDLSQYTTPLPNVNSADYREKNERAERLAMEIEGGDTHRSRAQLENGGEDEEMAFSAVHRNQRPRNNHQNSNNLQWRRGAGAANVNGGSRMGNQGGANVSGIGRGGGGPGSAPMPRQTLPPVQLGGQAPPPRSAAGSSQPPFPSAHQIPQSQISPKSSGFGQQQDRSPDSRSHSQQQQERNFPPNARSSTEYNRQSSAGSEGRNLAPSSSNGKPEVKVAAPPAGMAVSTDGRSPQSSSAAKDTKKPGGMPSPVEQPSGGVDRTPKQAPWGGNQKQSQPMPPRSEPLPPRPQVALPVTSAPRTQPLEQKLPPQKNDEAKKIESLQEFGKSLSIQYDSHQSKDAKISPRPLQQPVAGHSPSRAESEGAGHDGQSLTQKSTSSEQATIGKQPSEQSLTPKSGNTDKAVVGENDGDSADKQQSIAKMSTLNPNAKEFTLNPNAKEFNPAKMFQPVKPVTSPTPPRVIPGMAPPAAAPAPAPMIVPAGYISVQPYQPVMLPGAPQMRPMPGSNKRATVSVGGRVDQAQAATGQPIIAPQAPPYNIIPLMPQSAMPQVIPTHLLDPSQISAQQQSGQQPIPLTTMIVNQPGVPMTQHIVGGQTQVAANPQMNPPPPPPSAGGQQGGAHPSSSPVHQQQPQQAGPMPPPQTPTSGTPQPNQPPPQIFYSQQQQPGQGPQQVIATMQGTPPSPQQQHAVFPPQHFTTLQHQLGHMGAGTTYQFTPGGPQQFQPMPLHMAGTPGAGASHGVVRMAGLQHPHMTQPMHVIMSQPGQLHPAQMQSMMGQGALAHPGIPGGLPTQPTQLANIGPQGFITSQPMGNIYYPVPFIAQPGSFHPAGHAIPSSMQFQPTQ